MLEGLYAGVDVGGQEVFKCLRSLESQVGGRLVATALLLSRTLKARGSWKHVIVPP